MTSQRKTTLTRPTFDIAVIGAGVFGSWSAYRLALTGASVVLVDAYGPGNSRASSGGESRMIRLGYGPDEIYTRMSQRSLESWRELSAQAASPLFLPTGILWLAQEHDSYCEATLETLRRCNIPFEKLDPDELATRYPQLQLSSTTSGILEPNSGVLLAREAVKSVVAKARAKGVTYLQEKITSPGIAGESFSTSAPSGTHRSATPRLLNSIETASGKEIFAGRFVFACGPWLPKLFPDLLGDLIRVTRQEVIFFGVPAGDDRFNPERLPAWIDFNHLVYGIPNLDHRGFKLAIDAHGPQFDPDAGERVVSDEGLHAARSFLAKLLPAMATAPVTESRVCQYENTANGDFLIDRHPAFENIWLVGGGSGHGFKHGPAVGEHVANLISGRAHIEPRFSLANKDTLRRRLVF